jgi:hypothetical protein
MLPSGHAGLEQAGLDPDQIERCDALRDLLTSEDAPLLAVGIRRAYADRLVVNSNLENEIELPEGVPGPALRTYKDVLACMPGAPLSFQVRTHGAFTVVGSQSGFQHRVHENSAGRCVIDPQVDPLRQGRAWMGCTFQNHDVAFRLLAPRAGEELPEPDLRLQTSISASAGGKLILNPAVQGLGQVVPVQLNYNPIQQLLYLVDISARGLVPIPVAPFPPTVLQSYN